MDKPVEQTNTRPIITAYYKDVKARQLIRANNAKWAWSAVKNTMHHMSQNHYGAMLAEISDTNTGTVHAVFRFRLVDGFPKIETIFKRAVKENE